MLGGAAYLGSRIPGALAAPSKQGGKHLVVPGQSMLELPGAEAPVDTVVVLMMENRSVDHYLGWLATDDTYLAAGRSRYGKKFGFEGDNTQTFLDAATGLARETYHLPSAAGEENPYRGCHHPDPGHGWNAGRAQRDGGFLAPGSGNDEFAVGYYLADDVPTYASLARRFTTFDTYHCSLLGPTFPNREYLHSAQSGGHKDNHLPIEEAGFDWPNIWDRFQAAGMVPGVDAGYFFVDLPTILLWGERMLPFMQHLEDYFARAATGTLPRVTFVDPGFTTGMRTDDHPYADIRAGQRLVLDVVKAFVESPHWERGVLLLTYDEWGGFFDHVAPPRLADDRATPLDPGGEEDFGQAGFRVPTLMLSPYALAGFVDHRLYDHTSILRFLEWRFLGAPAEGPGNDGDSWFLTPRDRHANNVGWSLRSELQDAGVSMPLLPEVPVTSLPCEGEELEGLPVGLPDLSEAHAFEKALDAGYFERVGFTPDLRPLPVL